MYRRADREGTIRGMRWREFLMYSLLAACGRVGFEGSSTTGDGNVTGDGSGTGGSDGGDPCEAGDGVCRVSCLAVDPDCTTTCGDGLCVGNAGESCKTCAELYGSCLMKDTCIPAFSAAIGQRGTLVISQFAMV